MKSDTGHYLAWAANANVAVEVDAPGIASAPVLSRELEAAFAQWAQTAKGAPQMTVKPSLDPTVQNSRTVHRATVITAAWPGDEDALAVTTYTYRKSTGEITDADIVINGTGPCLLLGEDLGKECFDLRALLLHEAGHFMGLDHDEEHKESVMYPSLAPGDLTKRTLTELDEESLSVSYGGRKEAPPDPEVSATAPARSEAFTPLNSGVARQGCQQTNDDANSALIMLILLAFFASRRR